MFLPSNFFYPSLPTLPLLWAMAGQAPQIEGLGGKENG